MSVDFNREIYSDAQISIRINFTGLVDGEASKSSLKMTLFAFNKRTGIPVFNSELPFETIEALYQHLNSISIVRDSSNTQTGKFIESSKDVATLVENLKSFDPKYIGPLLNKLASDQKVSGLIQALSDHELESINAAYKHQSYKQELANLEKLIELECNDNVVTELPKFKELEKYVAKQPEKIFQNWIEQNLWVFGIDYSRKHDARKIAMFSEADIMMESLDGFLDLIELKRPKLGYDLLQFDASHNCYYPSKSLAEVIGQSLFYLQKMDEYKGNIEKEYKVKVLRPRIKVIAGRTKDFDDQAFETLRMLNSNLSHIQILSYDYILSCARKAISSLN